MQYEEISSSDEIHLSQENFTDYFTNSLETFSNIAVDDLLRDGILTLPNLEDGILAEEPDQYGVPIASFQQPLLADSSMATFPTIELSHNSFGIMFPPSQTSFIGNYGFDIYFEPPKNRNTTWIYKKDRDKLYVTKDLPVPIHFTGSNSIPKGARIRTLAVFQQPQHMNENVQRCTNHITQDLREGKAAPYHLIQCQSKQAIYEEVNQVYTVGVPYEVPQRGQNYSTYLYKFVCFGSCPGGLNRRPIKIIFMLEFQNSVIGQRCLELKICASPQRDSKNEDNRQQATTSGNFPKKKGKKAHKSGDSSEVPVEALPYIKEEIDYALDEVPFGNEVSIIQDNAEALIHPSCPPACNDWPGNYGFNIKFVPENGRSFMYNSAADKLYIAKDVICSIAFTTQATVGNDMFVQVMPVFALPQHAQDAVHRCPLHTQTDRIAGLHNATHLISCQSPLAVYHENPVTTRQSVVVPFYNAYDRSSTFLFKFCCLGSCPGGLNRRALKVIFTLEHNNVVIGRRSVDVKICASPQRDLKNDEKLMNARKPPENSEPPPKKKKPIEDATNLRNVFSSFNVMDTTELDPSDDEGGPYTITLTDPSEYAFLLAVQKRYNERKTLCDDPDIYESSSDESD